MEKNKQYDAKLEFSSLETGLKKEYRALEPLDKPLKKDYKLLSNLESLSVSSSETEDKKLKVDAKANWICAYYILVPILDC